MTAFEKLYRKNGLDAPKPPTEQEKIEAQVLYTAMMTDTLLEEDTDV